MPSITVKNIPPALYDRVKRAAKANHRSINSEIIACLEREFLSQPFDPERVLARARQLREKFGDYRINDDEINQAKNEGRE